MENIENIEKEIKWYLDAFCDAKIIKPYIQYFTCEEVENKLNVKIFCFFPEILIGYRGKLVSELSCGFSIHLDKSVKVEVLKYIKNK